MSVFIDNKTGGKVTPTNPVFVNVTPQSRVDTVLGERDKNLQVNAVSGKMDASKNEVGAPAQAPVTDTYETIFYPSNINDESFKHRRVEIIVKDLESMGDGYGSLIDKMETVYGSMKNTAEKAANNVTGGNDNIKDFSPGKEFRDANRAKPVFGITLPLPTTELLDAQEHGWSQSESMASELLKAGIGMLPLVGGKKVGKAASELSAAVGYRKPLIDPGYFQDYTGSQPRRFVLTFTFIPNNASEAESIRKIIYNMKKYTSPSTAIAGVALRSPYFFDIKISNPYFNNLINLASVVCTSMSVTYGTDGSMSMFSDGVPKVITMSLVFAERFLVTADMY